MSRPRQYEDEVLLAATRECLQRHGPTVSTAVIAERAGVSQGLLFQRYGTKEELLRAALAPPCDVHWKRPVQEGPDDRPAREQLLELGSAIHRFFVELMPLITMARSCHLEPRFESEDAPPYQFFRALSGWFARASAKGLLAPHDPDAAALSFIGSFQVRPWFQQIVNRALDEDGDAYVEQVVEMVWRGLIPDSHREEKT